MIPNGTGSLRHSVDLYSSTSAPDSYGEAIQTWTKYDTVWAANYPMSSAEMESAMQTVGVITSKWVIRYHATVDIKHRMYFGTRVLEIVAIANEGERNEYLVLSTNEVLA